VATGRKAKLLKYVRGMKEFLPHLPLGHPAIANLHGAKAVPPACRRSNQDCIFFAVDSDIVFAATQYRYEIGRYVFAGMRVELQNGCEFSDMRSMRLRESPRSW